MLETLLTWVVVIGLAGFCFMAVAANWDNGRDDDKRKHERNQGGR